jgi:hypothetical protein
MSIHRREFLESLAVASMAALPLAAAEAKGEAAPVADAWDVSWVDKLKTKHLAVFDSPGFSEGAALLRANVWKNQYKEVYNTNPSDMTAVLVLRHEGIWLAMNDDFWKKYDLGKRKKLREGESTRFYERNPNSSPTNPMFAEFTIPKFTAGGGIVLACNLAFSLFVVDLVKKDDKLQTADAEAAAKKYLMPGVIMQPSGVFAVLRAQEAGCNYILAS